MYNLTIIGGGERIEELKELLQSPSYNISTIISRDFMPQKLEESKPDLALVARILTMQEGLKQVITNETILQDNALRGHILGALKERSIPFAFFGNSFNAENVLEAVRLGALTYVAATRPLTPARSNYVREMVHFVLGETNSLPRYLG